MKNKTSWVLITAGAMLLLAALFLVIYNINEDKEGDRYAMEILEQLKEQLPEAAEEESQTNRFGEPDLFAPYEEEAQIEIDRTCYLGILLIPSIGIELPVQSEWSYPALKRTPCRYKGSVAGGDLIIAAHNYRSHFGRINRLNSGDSIYFTDAAGVVHIYQVIQTEELGGYDIEKMEFGSASDWDLTVFTCTVSGQSRVTVRAVELE